MPSPPSFNTIQPHTNTNAQYKENEATSSNLNYHFSEISPPPSSIFNSMSSNSMATKKPMAKFPLLVCDFDCSLIDVDSDEFVLGHFGGSSEVDVLRHAYKTGKGSWLQIVSQALSQLFFNRKIPSLDALKQRLEEVPMNSFTSDLLKSLSQKGVHIIIISDANTFFIETILENYQVRDCIQTIVSNVVSQIKTPSNRDFIQLSPATSFLQPHDCSTCPKNLCKTFSLKRFLHSSLYQYPCVFYIGDGMNDLCPLQSGLVHYGFIRKHYSLYQHFIQVGHIQDCKIQIWDHGKQLHEVVMAQYLEVEKGQEKEVSE